MGKKYFGKEILCRLLVIAARTMAMQCRIYTADHPHKKLSVLVCRWSCLLLIYSVIKNTH